MFRAWQRKARERYKDMVSGLKRRRKKPESFPQDIWNSWIAAWDRPEVIAMSQQNRRNRRGGEATEQLARGTHTSGPIAHVHVADEMSKELGGAEPSRYNTFLRTHTLKGKGQSPQTFVNEKARAVHETYVALEDAVTQQQAEIPDAPFVPPNEIFLEAVGGMDKHHRVYGLGSIARTVRRPRVHLDVDASSSPPRPDRIAQLESTVYKLQEDMVQNQQKLLEQQQTIIEQLRHFQRKPRDRSPSPDAAAGGVAR